MGGKIKTIINDAWGLILNEIMPYREFKDFPYTPSDIPASFAAFIGPLINKYSKFYAEKGLKLPPDFSTDPTGWTVVIYKMSAAATLLERGYESLGEEEKETVREGLELFGKYCIYLKDATYSDTE